MWSVFVDSIVDFQRHFRFKVRLIVDSIDVDLKGDFVVDFQRHFRFKVRLIRYSQPEDRFSGCEDFPRHFRLVKTFRIC